MIDTHCHLDATDHAADTAHTLAALGVQLCVLPAVDSASAVAVRDIAHRLGYGYALGLHPVVLRPDSATAELRKLETLMHDHRADPHWVAIGEIGCDFFIPAAHDTALRTLQQEVLDVQLALAQHYCLPVILHSRAAVEAVRLALRSHDYGGIAHAFNGSWQQAVALLDRGYKLGFGGAALYPRAQHLRRLLQRLPEDAIVLETDAPDMPPPWLYATVAQRAQGQHTQANHPRELPRIARELAQICGRPFDEFVARCHANSLVALPRCAALLRQSRSHAPPFTPPFAPP